MDNTTTKNYIEIKQGKGANSNPLISIITISFNSIKTIERTILSVLNQTYKNIEYIIIDGGSTDGTVDIIKKYSDRISYWVSEKDEGISDAFNKGILASHGEIIGIINSDDWYENDALETIINLDNKNHADFYIGALKYWNNNKYIIEYPDPEYQKKIYYRMTHINHPASFIKRKTYNDVGLFNTKYKYVMDRDLFIRISKCNKRGIFTNKIISNMLSGGVSLINEKETCKEGFIISTNKILGTIWYFISLLKINIKNIIKYCGGDDLIFLLKSFIYKKKKNKSNSKYH